MIKYVYSNLEKYISRRLRDERKIQHQHDDRTAQDSILKTGQHPGEDRHENTEMTRGL